MCLFKVNLEVPLFCIRCGCKSRRYVPSSVCFLSNWTYDKRIKLITSKYKNFSHYYQACNDGQSLFYYYGRYLVSIWIHTGKICIFICFLNFLYSCEIISHSKSRVKPWKSDTTYRQIPSFLSRNRSIFFGI